MTTTDLTPKTRADEIAHYLNLTERFTCTDMGNGYWRIETDCLYPDGDVIDLFYKVQESEEIILTDLGETTQWLRMKKFSQDNDSEQNKLIEKICQQHHVTFYKGMLKIDCKNIKCLISKIDLLTKICVEIAELNSGNLAIPGDQVLKLYENYRKYIEQENALINNRLSWLLVSQGLIFSAYVNLVKTMGEASQKSETILFSLQSSELLQFLLTVVGLFSAILVWLGIEAAMSAIDVVKIDTDTKETKFFTEKFFTEKGLLPLTGGGNRFAKFFGKYPARGIPLLFGVSWLTLFIHQLLETIFAWNCPFVICIIISVSILFVLLKICLHLT